MQQPRQLGRSDIAVAPLMLGGNVFGFTADRAASFAVLDRFVELGGDFIDTADVYSAWAPGNQGGESEAMIGAWLKQGGGRREAVKIATKAGKWAKYPGLGRDNLRAACDESLARLGIERIDLYQLHEDDAALAPEDFLGTLSELVKAGKVRAIGLSNFSAARLEQTIRAAAAMGAPRIETMQPEYSLMNREIERDIAPLCVREGVSLLTYFALASGYLTGKYRTAEDKAKSIRGGRMDQYMRGNGPAVLAALDQVSAAHGATPAQIALAWLMAKPGVAAPIASATSAAQMSELMGALRLTLSEADIAALDRASG